MNCRNFQKRLYEYVEGSLSASAQAAAARHLAGCNVCRQAVRQEQQLAQFMSSRLQRDTMALTLRPDIRNRILTASEAKSSPPAVLESISNLSVNSDHFAVFGPPMSPGMSVRLLYPSDSRGWLYFEANGQKIDSRGKHFTDYVTFTSQRPLSFEIAADLKVTSSSVR
jgi:anti-sigma factor RsiW